MFDDEVAVQQPKRSGEYGEADEGKKNEEKKIIQE